MAAGTGGVVAGELELNHECSLMHWLPEDFESKLQVESEIVAAFLRGKECHLLDLDLNAVLGFIDDFCIWVILYLKDRVLNLL
ncbi:hypothetical protein S83_042246 [Arachis hypogaea]